MMYDMHVLCLDQSLLKIVLVTFQQWSNGIMASIKLSNVSSLRLIVQEMVDERDALVHPTSLVATVNIDPLLPGRIFLGLMLPAFLTPARFFPLRLMACRILPSIIIAVCILPARLMAICVLPA
jgi:hypothetical protein